MMQILQLMRLTCLISGHCVQRLDKLALAALLLLSTNVSMAANRDIASFVSQDEVIVVPREEDSWYSTTMIDDDNGIMNSMRVDIKRWQEQERFLDLWGLEKSGLFEEVSIEDKRGRISRDMLRYADKRLSGEVKKADKGSNLYRVGQAQKTLSPTSTVSLFSGYAIKFQVRALQGKGTIIFKNPYTNTYLETTVGGRREFVTERWFNPFGFRTAVNVRLDKSTYFTTFEQIITENIRASLVSEQGWDQGAFGQASDKRIQLNYFKSF